ncbi:hypothetical protein [Lysobacter humi (ex Lee et al. 2017)]
MTNPLRPHALRACMLFTGLVAWPAASAAAGTCTGNFKEVRAPDGATFYMTSSAYPALDARKALDDYKAIATGAGYMVFSPPDHRAAQPSMGIGKPPSPHPVSIMVDKQASTITLTTIVAPGERASATEERARLCDLVAEFDARRPGAAPRLSAEQRQMQARTSLPEPVASVRMLEPTVPFDRAAAKAALQPGRSVIRGQACGHWNGAMAYAAGSTVALYPATPHLEQLIQLSKKAKPGRDQVVPDPAVLETRMEATANERGEFQFSQMKPGRYLLVTRLDAMFSGDRDVYAGRVESGSASANVYRTEGYTFSAADELSKFVEIGRDGEVVKVTLQPSVSANPFRRGMGGSILGCRQL